ncbi:hypothetical protein BDA96_09G039800 [Sorghum bicolor]|uniref:Uncharacterized protein n=1 Tax=Sorghum bicolor TaxID=4558 RepID=A0A921Q8C7_SORBI|nr:hypothetical protein BDA96_09G039800 [Sorghum bicolor]
MNKNSLSAGAGPTAIQLQLMKTAMTRRRNNT